MSDELAMDLPAKPGGVPVGQSLGRVIHERGGAGDGQFQAADGGDIRCLTCRRTFPADSQRADDVDRVEGASDPADMTLVLDVACPDCGAAGSLVLRYGPEASAEEADVLVALRRTPSDPG